jgi:thioredoxin 2
MDDTLLLPCAHCNALNRIPASRLAEEPVCGRCAKPLFERRPIELGDATLERHVSRSSLPLLVDFWAPWCGPCQAMAPAYQAAAAALEPMVRLGKVNSDENPTVSSQYHIRSIPTLVLFRGGREIARRAGAADTSSIVRWVHGALA